MNPTLRKLRIKALSPTLRPAFFVPAAAVLVFVTVAVTLVFSSWADPSTSQKVLSWATGISAAGVSAFVGILAFQLNRGVAIRSTTIEAQKMLLEINKQYITFPELLYIENEHVGPVDPEEPKTKAKLKAMVYLKLNVFEVIFAVLPEGPERETWLKYFEASLSKSDLLAKELDRHHEIYHPALIDAFTDWKNATGVGVHIKNRVAHQP
jgi:hypothetical protein